VHRSVSLLACSLACFALAWSLATSTAISASSSSVVSAAVPSATSIDTLGCLAGAAGRTDFTNVTPGSFTRTASSCTIGFGSSNDAARLLTYQADGGGDALAKASTGMFDMSFDGNSGTGNGSVSYAGNTWLGNDEYSRVKLTMDPATGNLVMARPLDAGTARITRTLPTDVLDTSWDGISGVGDGIVDVDNVPLVDENPQGIVVQPDGKIVYAHHSANDFYVTRLNTNGTPDTSFGGSGTGTIMAYHDISDGDAKNLAMDSQGRFYVPGFRSTPFVEALVVRLTTSGTWWDDVPDNALDADAQVGTLGNSQTDGVASFRFGFRAASNTPPGQYLAPIIFQVLAP